MLLTVFTIMLILNSTFTLFPFYLLDLGSTTFFIGVQTALFFIVSIGMRFYFGPMADNIGRKIPLLIGAGCFAVSALLFTLTSSLILLTLIRMLQALGLSAFLSSSMSAIADMAPAGKLGTYMSTYRIISTLSLLVGPAAALYTVQNAGYNAWFLLCTILGIIAFGLLLFTRFPPIVQTKNATTGRAMWSVLFDARYRIIYFGIGLTAISYGALLSFAALHISAVTDISNPGIYFIIFGLSSLFFTMVSGYLSDKLGRPAIAWPSVVMLGLGIAALSQLEAGQYPILIISSLLTGIGFNGGLSVLSAWLVDQAELSKRASILSVQESIIDFSIGFIALAFGSFTATADFSLSFLITGCVIILTGIFLIAQKKTPIHQE